MSQNKKNSQKQKSLTNLTFFLVSLALGGSLQASQISHKAIYGEDNRKDIFEVSDSSLLEAAKSTVALVSKKDLIFDSAKGVYKVKEPEDLENSANICPDEPFAQQQTLAFCSGFVVGANKIATAGHCIPSQKACEDTLFVQGFEIGDKRSTSPTEFPASQVYSCDKASVIGEDDDFTILTTAKKIDAPILKVSNNSKLKTDTDLVMFGHPVGLPLKVSGGAQVIGLSSGTFRTNLDAFGGNSGSAILNKKTLEVEGILVSGQNDFTFDFRSSCRRQKVYPMDSFIGETATRSSVFLQYIP